ncbi:MAG: fibrillarin-like rRNA/tRNA 2'-O-methyltransferase [Candidatus Ranarchaeia archaeon]
MTIRVKPHEQIPNVVWARMEEGTTSLATVNLIPGATVYDERLFKTEGVEYRTWNPFKSKLAALLRQNFTEPILKLANNVLYLGAASGTTTSHVSDIVGKTGIVYAVEFAPRSARDLLAVADVRSNIVPILADAHNPETYSPFMTTVDVVYQDIAQPDQANIAVQNAKMFLKPNGYLILAVKARSIDVKRDPNEIFLEQRKILEDNDFRVLDQKNIESFEKDHAMLIAKNQ